MGKLYEIPISVSINEALQVHSPPSSMPRQSSYDKDCASTVWPLAQGLLTIVLDQCFPTCQVSVLIFENGLVIKSVWEMLGQFLNCRTSQGLQHADIKQCLLDSCDLGTFGGRYKVPQESTLWEAMNFWEIPCTGLQCSPRPTWGLATKPSPRDTASSLPSGHATPADEGPAHFVTQCPLYRGALCSARIHSSSLELIVCLYLQTCEFYPFGFLSLLWLLGNSEKTFATWL